MVLSRGLGYLVVWLPWVSIAKALGESGTARPQIAVLPQV